MKAGFSNALRSTFMFSKRGGRDTDVQFIVQKKGLLHILAANPTALLCSPQTLQLFINIQDQMQPDEEWLLLHTVHPTPGKTGRKGD